MKTGHFKIDSAFMIYIQQTEMHTALLTDHQTTLYLLPVVDMTPVLCDL